MSALLPEHPLLGQGMYTFTVCVCLCVGVGVWRGERGPNKHWFNECIQLLCQSLSPALHQRMLLSPEKGHANIWELRNYVLMVGLRLYGLLAA